MITIREQTEADKDEIWEIIRAVISAGDTYYFAPDSSKEKMLDYWFDKKKKGYVAEISETPAADDLRSDRKIAGIFFVAENFPDLASHIANAGFMVSPGARGKGVGRKMAEFSLAEAKRLGFRSMQFNFVVKSNGNAVKLWLDLGFEIIGEIPDAIEHPENGLTNALIMFRKL